MTTTATHHSNSIWGKQLLRTHGCDIGDVGEDVNEGHDRDGDEDGARKVPEDNTAQYFTYELREKQKI